MDALQRFVGWSFLNGITFSCVVTGFESNGDKSRIVYANRGSSMERFWILKVILLGHGTVLVQGPKCIWNWGQEDRLPVDEGEAGLFHPCVIVTDPSQLSLLG